MSGPVSAPSHHGGAPAPKQRRRGFRAVLGIFGELLITLGVVLGLYVVYDVWLTGPLYTNHQQDAAKNAFDKELNEAQAAGPSGKEFSFTGPGGNVALMRIPRLGSNWNYMILEDANNDDVLKRGPAHYTGTALPGQVGNFSVAGHRVTYASPFVDLDTMKAGDLIGVKTLKHWYIYKVSSEPQIVSPSDNSVILPVPGDPTAKATKKLLTLTTCNPKYGQTSRLIVHAELMRTDPVDTTPPEMQKGA